MACGRVDVCGERSWALSLEPEAHSEALVLAEEGVAILADGGVATELVGSVESGGLVVVVVVIVAVLVVVVVIVGGG